MRNSKVDSRISIHYGDFGLLVNPPAYEESGGDKEAKSAVRINITNASMKVVEGKEEAECAFIELLDKELRNGGIHVDQDGLWRNGGRKTKT